MCLVCLSNRKRLHCSEVYIVCDTVFQSEAQFSFTHVQLMFSASLNSLIHNEHSGVDYSVWINVIRGSRV